MWNRKRLEVNCILILTLSHQNPDYLVFHSKTGLFACANQKTFPNMPFRGNILIGQYINQTEPSCLLHTIDTHHILRTPSLFSQLFCNMLRK